MIKNIGNDEFDFGDYHCFVSRVMTQGSGIAACMQWHSCMCAVEATASNLFLQL
jgi:hypothetical protein